MNFSLLTLEIAVTGLALVVLLLDLWTAPQFKSRLGFVAMAGLLIILAGSFLIEPGGPATAPCWRRTRWQFFSSAFFW